MARRIITNKIWLRLSSTFSEIGIRKTPRLREQIEGMFWRARVGAPWRDIPWEFGKWETIYRKFRRWSLNGTLHLLFEALEGHVDLEVGYIDSTSIRAHQHAHGVLNGEDAKIGVSRGGPTTKIHCVVDRNAKPIAIQITAGNCHDAPVGEEIVDELNEATEELVGDKGYDSDKLRLQAEKLGIRPVIPRRRNSSKPARGFHKAKYRRRHVVENFFCKLKRFRAVATRYDKSVNSFFGSVLICIIRLWITDFRQL